MDELVKQVAQRTGISEDKAQEAVNTVVGFLKARLPEPIAGQLDGILNTAGGTIASAGDAIADKAGDILGGVLGSNKD